MSILQFERWMEINCTKRAVIIISEHEHTRGIWVMYNIIYVLGWEHESVRLFFFLFTSVKFPLFSRVCALTRQIPWNKQRNLHYNGKRITPR